MTDIAFTIRRWQLGDEYSLTNNANNIKIWNNVRDYFPYPYTIEAALEWIHVANMEPANFAIVVDGEAVGGIGVFFKEDIRRKNVEIGYWLGEPYWGKGILTQAVKRMIVYIFDNFPDIHRIYANAFCYNIASHRVLEKAGFKKEAILKEAVYKNDQFWDDHIYSLLRTDYTG